MNFSIDLWRSYCPRNLSKKNCSFCLKIFSGETNDKHANFWPASGRSSSNKSIYLGSSFRTISSLELFDIYINILLILLDVFFYIIYYFFLVIPAKRLKLDETLLIALVAAATFSILDTYLPSLAVSARSGAGFGIGANLVNFPAL